LAYCFFDIFTTLAGDSASVVLFLEKQINLLKCDLAQGMLKPQQQEV
jgi:hypothetical protein